VPFHIPLPASPAYALLDAGLEGVGLERVVQLHTVRRAAETAR
jgi:hypothetical protein